MVNSLMTIMLIVATIIFSILVPASFCASTAGGSSSNATATDAAAVEFIIDNTGYMQGRRRAPDTLAVQTASAGGELTPIESGDDSTYSLTLHGVIDPLIISNSQWNTSDPFRLLDSSAIVSEIRFPAFALLAMNHSNSSSGTFDESLVSLELLEILHMQQYTRNDSMEMETETRIAISYKVKAGELVLNTLNNTVYEQQLPPSSFRQGKLMIDLQSNTQAEAKSPSSTRDAYNDDAHIGGLKSLHHYVNSGQISDNYKYNSITRQVKSSHADDTQVRAQGLLTWWVPVYGVSSILLCCPFVFTLDPCWTLCDICCIF